MYGDKMIRWTVLMMIMLSSLLFFACSNEEKTKEPGKIETMTKEVGQEAVRMIKTPIDKAQAVADKEEQRAREMDQRNSQ